MMLLMYLMFIIAMNNKLNYSRYIITFNSYYLEMWATEWFLKWEIKTLVDKLRDKEEEIKKLKEYNRRLKQGNEDLRKQNSYRNKIVDIIPQDEKSVAEETIQDLQERIRFLEQCLDNKEKVNKSMREELQRYKDMWDSGEF